MFRTIILAVNGSHDRTLLAGATPERILLIRPSALGDVCRSVPVLTSLKRAFPGASIDWLVQDTFVDAIEGHPDLRRAIPFPRGEFASPLRLPKLAGWLWALRRERYDMVVDAQGLLRSGFFTWATGAKLRLGDANARESAARFYNRAVPIDPQLHAVDRMLGVVQGAGIPAIDDMRLHCPPRAARLYERHPNLAQKPQIVLAPTSRWPAKQWPAERFASLIDKLLKEGHRNISIVGARSERDQIRPVLHLAQDDPRVTDLVGETSIAELMQLIHDASLVVANDSAALHMAVGFERPVVALFGPTRVELVGPYRREKDVIQHTDPAEAQRSHKDPSSVELMERITVSEVLAACRYRLA